jgi:hypothetical protein
MSQGSVAVMRNTMSQSNCVDIRYQWRLVQLSVFATIGPLFWSAYCKIFTTFSQLVAEQTHNTYIWFSERYCTLSIVAKLLFR